MSTPDSSFWTVLIGIVGGLLSGIVGGVLRVTSGERALADAIVQNRREIEEHMAAQIADVYSSRQNDREAWIREIGETFKAIRQAMVDNQFWNRDNFVRRDEWQRNVDLMTANLGSLNKTLQESIFRLETKLDKISDDLSKRN